MSVLTICNTRSLGIHVVELDAAEQAMRSSWEGEYEDFAEKEEEDVVAVEEVHTSVSSKQLALIYSLQLAEA